MSKAEKFISEHTRKLTQYGDDYFLWVTPDEARKAVEIAREEIYEWVRVNLCNYFDDTRETFDKFLDDLKQTIKDE